MKGIDVERIRFEFGDSWTIVEKWDDADVFRNGIQRLSGSKAVDLVGAREGCLYLMEVKDSHLEPIQNKERQINGDLAQEIGQKVRDTVAGLVGAHRLGRAEWVSSCAKILLASSLTQPRVRVVAWIEDGGLRHAESHSKRGARHTTLYAQLQQSLVWLTRHVSMESPLRVTGIGDAHATRLGKP